MVTAGVGILIISLAVGLMCSCAYTTSLNIEKLNDMLVVLCIAFELFSTMAIMPVTIIYLTVLKIFGGV